MHQDLNFASQTKWRVYLPFLIWHAFCHVEFPGHVQKHQNMRLNKKINRLSNFMYNPRVDMRIIYFTICADQESVARGGPTLTTFFFFFFLDEGKDYPNSKAGHHWPASETPFKWRFADGNGPMMAQH